LAIDRCNDFYFIKIPDKINYAEKIPELSTEQKNDYLLRLLNSEDNLSIKLKKDIDHLFGKKTKSIASEGKTTMGELLVSVKKEEVKRENYSTLFLNNFFG